MEYALCSVCRNIPREVWTAGWKPGDTSTKLHTLDGARLAAEGGCRLCCVILGAIETPWRSYRPYLDLSATKSNLQLAKSPSGIAGDIMVHVGPNMTVALDVHKIPEPWCEIEPLMDLVNPINNKQLMRTWLNECNKSHIECAKRSNCSFPSRLLEVHADETRVRSDIRLTATTAFDWSSPHSAYVALSHCWGPPEKHSIKTFKSNLNGRMAHISINHLSNTFRDAVEITRDLGVRYLWIDSLCIIQDDKEDWASEAAQMASIYENAYCTLAALSSKDSTEGCRLVTDIQASLEPFIDVDISQNEHDRSRIRIFANSPRTWESEFYNRLISDGSYESTQWSSTDPIHELESAASAADETPLRYRAWEKECSRRNIYFGKNQLLWECCELKATAQLPWCPENRQYESYQYGKQYNDLDIDTVAGAEDDNANQDEESWHRLVEDYSARELTVGTDKLPALSGIAQRHQNGKPDSQYAAGIWSDELPKALLWKSLRVSTPRCSEYVAPSWSWASIQGPVTYKLGRHNAEEQRIDYGEEDERLVYVENTVAGATLKGLYKYRVSVRELPWKDDVHPVVTDIRTTPRYKDSYGAITAGRMVIKNALVAQIDPVPKYEEHSLQLEAITIEGQHCGNFHRDAKDDETIGQKTYVLRIERDVPCCHFWRGLVLVQVPGQEHTYRRIGLVRCLRIAYDVQRDSSTIVLV